MLNDIEFEILSREHYLTTDLWLPDYAAQRVWKFRLSDGTVTRHSIGTAYRLKKLLLKYVPVNVWYGVSRWGDARNVRDDESDYVSSKHLLSTEFVVDIDSEYTLVGLEKARRIALTVIHSMVEKPVKIRFTGNRGFHLVYAKRRAYRKDWRLRKAEMKEKGKVFILQLPKLEIIDKNIINNLKLVITLPNTPRKTGWLCQDITLEQLYKPIHKLIKELKFITKNMPEIPHHEMEEMTKPRQYRNSFEARADIRASFSLSNKCGNRRVPLLKYYYLTKNIEKDVQKLQRKYCIGNMWVFTINKTTYAMGNAAIPKERLIKVYKNSRSTNKSSYARFKKSWINFPENGQITNVTFLEQKTKSPESTTHTQLLNYLTGLNIQTNKNITNQNLEFRKKG